MLGVMKSLFIYFIIFILCVFNHVDSFSQKDGTIDGYIHRGIKLTITQDYPKAFSTFDSLKQFTNNDPRPYFYHAAAIQARMLDYENYSEENFFFDLITKTIDLSENWISNESTEAMGCFFKGASYTYRGFFHAQKKNYLKGIRDAMIGIKFLEKTIQLDSTFYDAYLGIGSYYYWRSRLTQMFNWLPLFPDQQKEGLEMIHKAIRFGRYGKDVSVNGLIWIEIDRNNFPRAEVLTLHMLQKYPNCRYFLWPLAEIYFKAGDFAKSIEQYEKIQESFKQEKVNNRYNEVVCGLKISRALLLLKNYNEAGKVATNTLALEKESKNEKRFKEKFDELKDIIQTCKEISNVSNNYNY